MAKKGYDAGVKEYRDTYWMPEYEPKDTDILACFKITPQPGVPREEVAAAVCCGIFNWNLDNSMDRFVDRP